MKIFIDTANLDEIEKAHSLGILDGVTSNPSLIKKAASSLKGETMKSYLNKILKLTKGTPVSLEVVGSNFKDMVEEGKKLFKKFNPVANNVVVKIPVNPAFEESSETVFDGIKAIKELSKNKIPVNCTLIFTPEQALMAAKAGAAYVSPFAGRIDDDLRKKGGVKFEKTDYYPAEGMEKKGKVLEDNGVVSGVDLVNQISLIFKEYDIKSEIIAASIRNPRQFRECALAGADIATLPFDVIRDSLMHHKTIEGMKKFTEDVVPEYEKVVKD